MQYLTEIIEKSARQNKYTYSTLDFEQVQVNRLKGKLYDRVSEYYRNLINTNKATIIHGYFEDEETGLEMIHIGIYDNYTGEQIL